MGSRGETRLRNIAGHLAMSHSGGKLEIDGAGSLKLTARNSSGSIARVGGTSTLDLNGGELRAENIVGPLDIESRNTELELDAAKMAKPPFRYNGKRRAAADQPPPYRGAHRRPQYRHRGDDGGGRAAHHLQHG
jgi:hypothetical protein